MKWPTIVLAALPDSTTRSSPQPAPLPPPVPFQKKRKSERHKNFGSASIVGRVLATLVG